MAEKKSRERESYKVWVPQLPDPENSDLSVQLPWVLKQGKFDKETVLVGHSSGASLILALLEKLGTKINKAVLVSGFLTRGGSRPSKAVKDEDQYDWEKIKNRAGEFFFINSTNDPWGCNDKQGRRMFNHLGGALIINNDGHMGSNSFKQPYKEFPLLLKLIL